MYWLPKVHKPGVPLRLIISSINTAGYKLAKFILPVLSPFTSNQYTLKDSNSFIEFINSVSLPSQFVMASFDIESLFTNIPLEETKQIFLSKYNPTLFYDISTDIFSKLLDCATKESIFIFNDKLYNQSDGVAMGSPLGPTYANGFMCHNEINWLNNCPTEFKPIHYKRYVDDTFLIFNKAEDIPLFLDFLNSQHNKINFTHEIEVNGSLSFLDVMLTKKQNKIEVDIYRKPTFTGQGLNWFSFCPTIYKINSIKTLLYRAYDLTSSYLNFHREINFLRNYFSKNNFTYDLFDKTLNNFLNKKFTTADCFISVPKLTHYIKIPFYGNISYELRKNLMKNLRPAFPGINFRIVFHNDFKINSFFGYKDALPDGIRSNICYLFTCPQCSLRYIGCSTRALNVRIYEHLGKSIRTNNLLTKPPFSTIRDHCHNLDHSLNKLNFEIVARLRNHSDTFLAESILIKKINPELNRRD